VYVLSLTWFGPRQLVVEVVSLSSLLINCRTVSTTLERQAQCTVYNERVSVFQSTQTSLEIAGVASAN
jgi:hypothetical protein